VGSGWPRNQHDRAQNGKAERFPQGSVHLVTRETRASNSLSGMRVP
jgi:hypothetical protein